MRKNHLIYLSLICLFFGIGAAQAQTKKFSSSEDVAIAFYKVGGLQPNLSGWIETSNRYQTTPWAKRDEVMEEELRRLVEKYEEYNPDTDDIILRTKVYLTTEKIVEEAEENFIETTYFLNAEFVSGDDILYFPYEYALQRYALMPFGMEKLTKTAISLTEYNYYEEQLVPNRAYYLIVRLRPKEAITLRPIEMHGEDRWVFKADIASSEIWDHRGSLLWEYTAPWYVSPELEKLKNIYDLKPTDSSVKGSVKPFIRNRATE